MARIVLASALGLAIALSGCLTNPPDGAPGAGAGEGHAGGAGSPGGASGGAGNTTGNATGPMVTLEVASSGQYPLNPGYAPATLSAAAGSNLHVVFRNADALPVVPHNWVLEGVDGAETEVVGNGESAEVMFPAPPPGEYAYYCSVGDHRARGMEGTLTVA